MDTYVSSASEANVTINMRKGDLDYLMEATTMSIYWFIDCKYFGQTNDLNFLYNFTNVDSSHIVEALVVASYEPLTTTVLPSTTSISPVTTISPNTIVPNVNISDATIEDMITTIMPNSSIIVKPTLPSTVTSIPLSTIMNPNNSVNNIYLPYICSNSSIIPPDPNKTYGHFAKKIDVRGE